MLCIKSVTASEELEEILYMKEEIKFGFNIYNFKMPDKKFFEHFFSSSFCLMSACSALDIQAYSNASTSYRSLN